MEIDLELLEKFKDANADITVGIMKNPSNDNQYGRIIFENNKFKEIKEYKDHNQETEFVNTGMIKLSKRGQELIKKLTPNSKSGEIYLTDIVKIASEERLNIKTIELNHNQALGFNCIEEFNLALQLAQQKWRLSAAKKVIFHDINSVYLSYDTKIHENAVIEQNCTFGPNVEIQSNAVIRSYSYIENATISGTVGPFAYIRSGTLEENAHIGAFTEMKDSQIGKNTKIKHLSYIGNAEIGENVNIGAGVILCNYDGSKKHNTTIENNAFIGANSCLIAPIKIGEGAYLSAGGVYNQDVDKDLLAIARAKQINLKNRMKKK
jgi:bifunctional UDP-N-acetylglucosamine pyrophosphorylase/glucosamine-1-phosphate N-acetyltransferase